MCLLINLAQTRQSFGWHIVMISSIPIGAVYVVSRSIEGQAKRNHCIDCSTQCVSGFPEVSEASPTQPLLCYIQYSLSTIMDDAYVNGAFCPCFDAPAKKRFQYEFSGIVLHLKQKFSL